MTGPALLTARSLAASLGTGPIAAGTCTGVVAVCLAVLAACGGSDPGAGGNPSAAPSAAAPAAEDSLAVELDRGDGAEPERYTLDCAGTVDGDLPDAAAACTALQGLTDPFAALPADQLCTEQFGGPQTARITGRWAGKAVDLDLARTNGCQIAQWNRLAPLLPGPVG
jgi:hypothetical protein